MQEKVSERLPWLGTGETVTRKMEMMEGMNWAGDMEANSYTKRTTKTRV
jgi:hypothetical protein